MKIDFTKIIKFIKKNRLILYLFGSCIYFSMFSCLPYIFITKDFPMLIYYFSIGLGTFTIYLIFFPKIYRNSKIQKPDNTKNERINNIVFGKKRNNKTIKNK